MLHRSLQFASKSDLLLQASGQAIKEITDRTRVPQAGVEDPDREITVKFNIPAALRHSTVSAEEANRK
jgi:hypothetical protein